MVIMPYSRITNTETFAFLRLLNSQQSPRVLFQLLLYNQVGSEQALPGAGTGHLAERGWDKLTEKE